MPFPVAHALFGASAAAAFDRRPETRWQILLLSALLGVCPDFDYLLNWLNIGRGGWHHGFTHSIMFAFFAGAITTFVSARKSLHRFVAFSAAVASHPLLDYLMTESRGVALWWPFTDRRYKFRGPNPIDYTWSSTSLWDAAVDVMRISLIELIMFVPLLVSMVLLTRWLRSKNGVIEKATELGDTY